jgi:hypothetical protein
MPQVRVVLRRRPFHLPCEPTSSTFYATRRDLERWRTLFAVSHLAVRGMHHELKLLGRGAYPVIEVGEQLPAPRPNRLSCTTLR